MPIGTLEVYPLCEDFIPPTPASDDAVGYDLAAVRILERFRDENGKLCTRVIGKPPVVLNPGQRLRFGPGCVICIPYTLTLRGELYQMEVRPRSGLAEKGIILANAPGTIDPDYRGEVGILLENRSDKPYRVEFGERIAQLVISKVERPTVRIVDKLPPTRRGAGGFGSTGRFGVGLGVEEYEKRILNRDLFFMTLAVTAANRSTCVRGADIGPDGKIMVDEFGRPQGGSRRYGCVVVKNDVVLATGFNTEYLGSVRCAEVGCLREQLGIKSGTQIEKCRAVHAEWKAITSALRQGTSAWDGATMYITANPCEICAKLIADAGITTVVTVSYTHLTLPTKA